MLTSINTFRNLLVFFITCFGFFSSSASHIVGGGFTYKYLGDTVVSGQTLQKYRVSLEIYQDCVTGVPDAINQDNPAFFTIYKNGSTTPAFSDTAVYYDPKYGSGGSVAIPHTGVSSPCGYISATDLPELCLLRKTFVKTYYFPFDAAGYTVVYQRCCRNASIINVVAPGDNGSTFFCNIPATSIKNNSAVFSNYPPQVICFNTVFVFDHSATDADGDSLSYELGPAYSGASDADIKPVVAYPPPYEQVGYFPPYTYDNPMPGYPPLQIDAKTGSLRVTPNKIGRYLIGVVCKEWRNGVLINIVAREFQWTVTDCAEFVNSYRPYAGQDRTILVGDSIHFNASGSARYLWYPGTYLDNAYIADPIGTFSKPGVFTYLLTAESDSGCTGSDTINVTVMEHSNYAVPNAFTPNGDGRNDVLIPMPVAGSTLRSYRVFNRWGKLLFETGAAGTGWDGTCKGTAQDAGVFAWQIEYIDEAGEQRVQSGSVVLLR